MSKGKFYCENVFRNILGVFLIIHASTLYSQISLDTSLSFPNYHIKKINTEDGLPLNEIMDLHFTSTNFLWISTRAGLVRYDGRKFSPIESVNGKKITSLKYPWFYHIKGEAPILGFSRSQFLQIDSQGLGLKIRPNLGRYKLGNRSSFIRTKESETYFFTKIPTSDSSYYYGINDIDIHYKLGNERLPIKCPEGSPALRVLRTFSIQNRVFNFTSDGYFLEFKLDEIDTILRLPDFNFEAEESFPSQVIWNYGSKATFLFHNRMLYKLSLENGAFKIKYFAKNLPNYNYQVAEHIEDSEMLFLGTMRNGLIQISKSSIKQISILDFCPSNFDTYALVEIGKDSIMNSSGVLFHNNKASCELLFHKAFRPRTLFYDEESERIYGAGKKGLAYYSKSRLKERDPPIIPNVPRSACKTIIKHRSKIYFTLSSIGLCVLENDSVKEVLSIPEIYHLRTHQLKVLSDSILVLAGSFGLLEINLNQNNYKTILGPNSIEITSVNIYDEQYWITTFRQGIFIRKDGNWHSFNPEQFPELKNCHEIRFLDNRVFLPTNAGLFSFYIKEVIANSLNNDKKIAGYTFGKEDGLFSYEFNGRSQIASIHTEDDKLIFPNLNGIVIFDNKQFQPPRINKEVYLEYLILDKKDTCSPNELNFPHNFQSLHAKVTHPFYGRASNSKLFYRIPEISQNWNSFNPDDPIRIDRLPWGNYSLQLNIPGVAASEDQIQSLFKFSVSPPFYLTPSFILIVLLSIAALIFSLFFISAKRERRREIELESIIQERTNSLAESKKNVEKAIRIRDKMITVFSHDIRGPLGFFKKIVSEIQDKVAKTNFRDIENELNQLYMSSESSYETASSVIKWIEGQINPLVELKEIMDLEEIVLGLLLNKRGEFEKLNLKVNFSISEDCKFPFEKGGLEIILNNIIQNSIKYANSKIEIKAKVSQNQVHISVEDDGGGIQDLDVLNKLNKGGTVESRLGKNGQVGAGLGLYLVREIVHRNNGSILFENYNQGLKVNISLAYDPDS
tara:strand:- start:34691 stop:37741 length:3051 start_codon:yes stop_codon:yes gene_type:complete